MKLDRRNMGSDWKQIKPWALAACLTLAGLTTGWGQDYQTGPVDVGEAVVELVSEVSAVRPGQTVDLALRVDMDPHWHVYWVNPGDTGQPPEVQWQKSAQVELGEIEFPYPHRIPWDVYVSYGYEGEALFPIRATVSEAAQPGETLRLEADVNFLICAEVCVPRSAKLALELPVGESGESMAASPWAEEVSAARERVPPVVRDAAIGYEKVPGAVTLRIDWPGFEGEELEEAYFFIEQEGVVNSAEEQSISLDGDSLLVGMRLSEFYDGSPLTRLSGILYDESGFEALGGAKAAYFDSGLSAGELGGAAEGEAAGVAGITFGKALLFAFVGGLILNLMPCVFPILSVKALGFVQQAGEDKGRILAHGLTFGIGVLLSFWVLAGTLIALRAGGSSLGWGFQLQEPWFIAALLVIIFLFGLSLAGVFEVGTSAIGLAGKMRSTGLGGSFWSGVLATAVATPCTGPLMGPALGFALTLSAFQALVVFTLLGLGMATPYVTLSAFPGLIKKLPRPGPWMETFKQLMAFPMFATCIWLIWLMGAHVGLDGLVWTLGGLLLIAIGAWVYGRWAAASRPTLTRRVAIVCGTLALAGGYWAMLPHGELEVASEDGGPDSFGIDWMAFSPERVEALRAEGRPVFVDFTAKWCLTCKVNKRVVFSSDEVKERFRELGVAMVEADWTKRDPVITEALEAHGRSGVPFYLLYDGRSSRPIVLPELLTPGIVLDALEEMEERRQAEAGEVAMGL